MMIETRWLENVLHVPSSIWVTLTFDCQSLQLWVVTEEPGLRVENRSPSEPHRTSDSPTMVPDYGSSHVLLFTLKALSDQSLKSDCNCRY